MTSLSSRIIRTAFRLAEPVAPRLAGRIGFELFCRTADRRRLSPAAERALRKAGATMARAERHRLKIPSGEVAAHEFRPESAQAGRTALLVHGWNSRAEHMLPLAQRLLAAGFRAIAIDLPGHGRSAGRRTTMALAVEAVHAAAAALGPFDVGIGHSFGGAVLASAAAGSVTHVPPIAFGRLVLIAAPNSMPALFAEFADSVGLGRRSRKALGDNVLRVTGSPLERFVCEEQLAGRRIETLVLHAPDDREVAANDAEALARAGDHVTLRWAKGLGHRRILIDRGVLDTVATFAAGHAMGTG